MGALHFMEAAVFAGADDKARMKRAAGDDERVVDHLLFSTF